MPRATICVDVDTPEQAAVDAWLDRWRPRLPFASANEGCGCCVDLYRVDAPPEALAELPPAVFCASHWSGIQAAEPGAAADPRRQPGFAG